MPDNTTRPTKIAEEHIAKALKVLGFNLDTESTKDTPYRIAKYWNRLLVNQKAIEYTTNKEYDDLKQIKLVTYPAPENSELVVVRDIRFISACEHHFLPVFGTCAIGYIPSTHIIGLSKFARIVNHVAHKPTTQEHVTEELGQIFTTLLQPRFLAIQITATHTCMSCRGVEEINAKTVTSFFHPSNQDTTKQEFYRNLRQYG